MSAHDQSQVHALSVNRRCVVSIFLSVADLALKSLPSVCGGAGAHTMEWACRKHRPLAMSRATFLPCRYQLPTREPGRCKFRHKSPPSTNSITSIVLLPDMHAPCKHAATLLW